MNDALISIEGLSKSFGGVLAVDSVSLTVSRNRLTGIIGPNGAGKTTLLNLISGLYSPSRGTIRIDGEDVSGMKPHQLARRGLTRTFQNLQIFGSMTALENVLVAIQAPHMGRYLRLALPVRRVRALEERWHEEAMQGLARVGLAGVAHREAANLPYGSLKRLELARAVALRPKCILLDEPAAGCNSAEAAELMDVIREVAAGGVSTVLVEHNMKVVMGICEDIVVLDGGRLLCTGSPATVQADPRVITAYLGTATWGRTGNA